MTRRSLLLRLRGRFDALARWLDRREDPLPLALARLGLGLVLLVDLSDAWWRGLAAVLWHRPEAGGLAWGAREGLLSGFFDGDGGPLLAVAVMALAACFAAGFFTRTSAALLLLAYAQLGALQPEGDRGIDHLFRAALLIFAVSPAGATLSVDALRRTGRLRPPQVRAPAFARDLMVLQLAWLYFSAGTHKVQGPWTPLGGFSALYLVLQDPHFARFNAPSLLEAAYPLTQLATLVTMAFEWLAPLLFLGHIFATTEPHASPGRLRRLFRRLRLRYVWILVGVGFHIALLATMRLGIFPVGALALYPALLSAEELSAWRKAWPPRSKRELRRS